MRLLALVTLAFVSSIASADILTLRDGLNGHFSTEETFIKSSFSADTNFGTDNRIIADAGGIQSLITFSDLIGSGANQIALGATIIEANLKLHVTNSSTTDPTVHKMLVDWNENLLTWNNAAAAIGGNGTPGFQTDDIDASSASIGSFPAAQLGDAILDITSVVQEWVNGSANFGLLIQTTSFDGVEFSTSQDAFHVRPELTIEYQSQSVPGPSGILLFAIALLASIGTRKLTS